ncbi:hypothetical protein ACFLRI_03305 [Bacteroidota bacterium]
MLKKSILLFLISINIVFCSFGQDDFYRAPNAESETHFKDRLIFGGGAGMQFGNQTIIEVSPKLSVQITERFFAGIGASYSYYRINLERIYGYGGLYITSIYGGSTFLDYLISKSILAHLEYESLNFEQYDNLLQEFNRIWISSVLVGGGYRQYFNNERSFIQILLLYNLNYQPNSPYSSPLIPRVQVFF